MFKTKTTQPLPETTVPARLTFEEEIAAYPAQVEAFNARMQHFRSIDDRIAKQRSKAAAAEQEAVDAKEALRALLRSEDEVPPKRLHELTGKERAAYSLSEEFTSYADALAHDRYPLELECAELADQLLSNRESLLRRHAARLLKKAIAKIDPELFTALAFVAWANQPSRPLDIQVMHFQKAEGVYQNEGQEALRTVQRHIASKTAAAVLPADPVLVMLKPRPDLRPLDPDLVFRGIHRRKEKELLASKSGPAQNPSR